MDCHTSFKIETEDLITAVAVMVIVFMIWLWGLPSGAWLP